MTMFSYHLHPFSPKTQKSSKHPGFMFLLHFVCILLFNGLYQGLSPGYGCETTHCTVNNSSVAILLPILYQPVSLVNITGSVSCRPWVERNGSFDKSYLLDTISNPFSLVLSA